MQKLAAIEGLRGYLALWVLVYHVIYRGYGVPRALEGHYAVDVFILVSGFVIFFLLDKKSENWKQFIIRRFFRLFPIFLVLFLISIPLAHIAFWNWQHGRDVFLADRIAVGIARIPGWWHNIQFHIPLHLGMVHGMVPESVLPDAPAAFLMPAWSISLEWQFYMIAPLLFALATSKNFYLQSVACIVPLSAFGLTRFGFVPEVKNGAFIPFHAEFFFFGALTYFLWKRYQPIRGSSFVVAGTGALFLLVMTKDDSLIPLALWFAFMGLVCEKSDSAIAKLILPVFTCKWAQSVGRASYSIYLSHMLVMWLVEFVLLQFGADTNKMWFFGISLALTVTITLAVSFFLYNTVETYGMTLGRRVAARFESKLVDMPNKAVA